jgi:hypothetical protein
MPGDNGMCAVLKISIETDGYDENLIRLASSGLRLDGE